jgi:hypothetical protein
MTKIPLSQDDLNEHLAEQLGFLEASARSFDGGFIGEAKRIATTIRVLMHETPQSHSVLGQLGLLQKDFVDTSPDYDPKSLAAFHGLVFVRATVSPTSSSGTFKAFLSDTLPFVQGQTLPFTRWWDKIVVVDQKKESFSRKGLILLASNKDGGAHVDPNLDAGYAQLKKSVGWALVTPTSSDDIPDVQAHSVRQIAHEVLKTFGRT